MPQWGSTVLGGIVSPSHQVLPHLVPINANSSWYSNQSRDDDCAALCPKQLFVPEQNMPPRVLSWIRVSVALQGQDGGIYK